MVAEGLFKLLARTPAQITTTFKEWGSEFRGAFDALLVAPTSKIAALFIHTTDQRLIERAIVLTNQRGPSKDKMWWRERRGVGVMDAERLCPGQINTQEFDRC